MKFWNRKPKFKSLDPWPYTYKYEPVFADPEPWRLGTYGGVAVIVGLNPLIEIANPSRLQTLASNEGEYLANLESDIRDNGIKEPLELVVDSLGRICMKEGHHRTIVASRLGKTGLPIRITVSEGRVAYGRPLSEMLVRLLNTAVQEAQKP